VTNRCFTRDTRRSCGLTFCKTNVEWDPAAHGGILRLAHRGVTHVRGKDCVHPDIRFVIVRMISFPARESGQRARRAVR
jgi:hypothetical protein